MVRRRSSGLEMRTVLFIDAVNFTEELKSHDRATITAKINHLREFAEFFFIYKLKGSMISELGDGFLILCPPEPHKVLNEAFACMSFIRAYNYGKEIPTVLNVRIAIHYGLIAPPEGDNYIDSNINLASRLEGKTPPNCICVSSVVHDIVSDTLRYYQFEELNTELKGFGQSKFYLVSSNSEIVAEPSRNEERLGFYLSTISALRRAFNWDAVLNTCKQALLDFKSNPEFTYQMALASMFLRKYNDAISSFEDCIKMSYNVADSLNFTGRAYCRLGNVSRAIEYFNKSIESNPKKFHAMVSLGEIYMERRQYDQAWVWGEKAMEIAPRYYAPRAILIALAIVTKKRRSIEKLVKDIPDRNRFRFRTEIEKHLKMLGAVKYQDRIDSAFISVYGSDSTKPTKASEGDEQVVKE